VSGIGTVTGPFVAEEAARGVRPPLRLLEKDSRGWGLLERSGALLCLDEFGDLWWGRIDRGPDIRIDRPAWPEETVSLREAIAAAVVALRSEVRSTVR
jgi:hypothetical protein